MIVSFVLIAFLDNGHNVGRGVFTTYEQCYQQQQICNDHYISKPCVCSAVPEKRSK